MPKEGLSIYFTITDKASPTLASIGDKTKALDKETQQLAQSYAAMQKANEGLIKKQTELQAELKKAKEETKEAKKAFEELGDAASQDAFNKAKEHQEDLRNQLSLTNKALRENEAIYKQSMETVRKGSLGTSGMSDTTGAALTSTLSALGKAGLGQMAGDAALEIANTLIGSAFGDATGSLLSSGLSGAISGAAMGSLLGPIGTAVGAAIGGAIGTAQGATQIFEAKDDAFKEYYAALYEDVNASTEDMISSGSTIAGSREQTQRAFAKRLGGDEEADAYLERVKTMAGRTNYGYDEITGYSQLLLNSYAPDEVFGVLQSLSDATAGLNLSSSDVSVMISGLSRMRTTGKATQEYLNYFSERGVDVYTALGEALGVDKSQIAGLVTKGEIGGEFAAQAILDYIDQEYGGLSEDLMSTYDAMTANLEDLMANLEAAGGEGYNEVRKEGLQAETEAYSGALGAAMEEINRIAGENQAYLENLSGQFTREALSAVLMGEETTLFSAEDQGKLGAMAEEYRAASEEYAAGNQDAGLRMEALKEEAEALATAAYESSEQYQTLQDVQLDQIEAIRENTAGLAAATNAYALSQEQSKGVASTWTDYQSVMATGDSMTKAMVWMATAPGLAYMPHAYGLDRVPYDGYPALLHEGERVKTAAEARAEDAGAGRSIQIVVSGNSFSGTGEEMADQVAEVIVRKLEEAAVIAAPR